MLQGNHYYKLFTINESMYIINWRIMEIERPKRHLRQQEYFQKQFTIYPNCPPWAMRHFTGRPVSVVGRVLSIFPDEGYMVLETDVQKHSQIRVDVNPFKFKYLFNQKQLKGLTYRSEYQIFREFIEPGFHQKEEEVTSEWVYVEKQKKEEQKKQVQKKEVKEKEVKEKEVKEKEVQEVKEKEKEVQEKKKEIEQKKIRQQWKFISAAFFRLNQFVEVRGRCVSERSVCLQEFTDFGQDFDLSGYNEALKFIIEQLEEVFY